MVKKEYWFSRKVPIILERLEWNLNFLDRFSKNTYQILWKSVLLEARYSMRTDGDGHDKASSRFSKFCGRL